jgi:hypothetical protein
MIEYFISYCPPNEQQCHCRCLVGELTDEQVREFERQSDIDYMSDYVLHNENELFLGEHENKRAHVAALEQYDRRIVAVGLAVSRLRAQHEWSPPPPVSCRILRTFAQHAPPEFARIFSSNEHVEFMLKCQQIAEFIRNPADSDSAGTRNITEYSVRYYRETQDVAKNYTTTGKNEPANYPRYAQALTGVGVPDIVEAYQASIEDSDGTVPNVSIASVANPIPVYLVERPKDTTLDPQDCPIDGVGGFYESQEAHAQRKGKSAGTLTAYRKTSEGARWSSDGTWGESKRGEYIFRKIEPDKPNSEYEYWVVDK